MKRIYPWRGTIIEDCEKKKEEVVAAGRSQYIQALLMRGNYGSRAPGDIIERVR